MAGVLQHLRSSTLNKRPNPASMVDGQIAINYASGSPGAFFKDTNGTLVKVGPVHVGATAPNVSPASGGTAGNSVGEQWLDTSGGTAVFKIWDGASWRSEAGEFVNVTGDTMTGSLTMGPSADIIFEGSVDDGFETTLTVTNPTADRTITLPNVTGTVVTTGDSGTVTSTMIADGTIVNADVNASAAIAGTKISPDFGSQTVQTTGIFSHALGSASAPTVTFTGDTNTGIYSPGADQVAISTNGTGRLFVDSNGNVGVGISPANNLHVSGGALTRILASSTSAGARTDIAFRNSASTVTTVVGFDGANSEFDYRSGDLAFKAVGIERARIDSSGRLLVGTSSARANLLDGSRSASLQTEGTVPDNSSISVIRNAASIGQPSIYLGKTRGGSVGSNTVVVAEDGLGNINFLGADGTNLISGASIGANVDGTPGANDMPGRLVFSTTADGASSPTERMRISANGAVRIDSTVDDPGSSSNGSVSGFGHLSDTLYLSKSGAEALHINRFTSDGNAVVFRRTGTQVGTISVTTTATAYNTSSDYRLKENVTAVTDGITRLQQLKPSRFNFIADPDKTVDGFLAHEVQDVVPEAISGEKDAVDDDGNPQYQGIDQSKLVPLLTAALQEAIGEIESLKARLTAAGL